MAGGEVTPTLIEHFNIPSTIDYGTSERRLVNMYVEATSTATGTTLDLSSHVSSVTAIATVNEQLDGARNDGTANTWSGTTITFAGHSGSGVWALNIVGYY